MGQVGSDKEQERQNTFSDWPHFTRPKRGRDSPHSEIFPFRVWLPTCVPHQTQRPNLAWGRTGHPELSPCRKSASWHLMDERSLASIQTLIGLKIAVPKHKHSKFSFCAVCMFVCLFFNLTDRKALDADDRISLISHPDGRQLLTILKCSQRDAGVYECVATNPLAAITTSCTLSIACKWLQSPKQSSKHCTRG